METGTSTVKRGMAEMQKGGVIMDVMNAEQAKIAEAAGASAVMALERVPADIRAAGGVARMADPTIIEEVMKAVSIPVMAKARIGHYVEAKCSKRWALIILMRVKCLPLLTKCSTLRRTNLPYRSSAERATWVKHCAESAKGRR